MSLRRSLTWESPPAELPDHVVHAKYALVDLLLSRRQRVCCCVARWKAFLYGCAPFRTRGLPLPAKHSLPNRSIPPAGLEIRQSRSGGCRVSIRAKPNHLHQTVSNVLRGTWGGDVPRGGAPLQPTALFDIWCNGAGVSQRFDLHSLQTHLSLMYMGCMWPRPWGDYVTTANGGNKIYRKRRSAGDKT